MGPGLVRGGLSGPAGETRPWIVLETRAETVTKLRSGDTELLWEWAEASEERELVAVTHGFVPFTDTSGVSAELGCFSAPLTEGEVSEEGEEGEEAAVGDMAPGWTGGGGARYLTLVDSKWGATDDAAGEVCLTGDIPEGTGGAGDLTDLGLGVSGFGGGFISEAWDIWDADEDSSWAERSADGSEGVGQPVWSTEHLLFSRMVNS